MSTIQLKNDIKCLAQKILETKIECKVYQKQSHGHDGGLYFTIRKLKYEARHKQLAYCFLMGRNYDEIERKCAKGNEPNYDYIQEIMDANTTTAENVRACA
jgi:hypothetical protein